MAQAKQAPVPWRCGGFRTAVQRGTGVILMAAGLAGAWYWQGQPLPAGPAAVQAALAGTALLAPLGLWQLLDSPRQRPPAEGELAVFNVGWMAPACAVLEIALAALGAGLIPSVVEGASVDIVLLWDVFLDGGAAAIALSMVAARNQRLLISPDGSAEYMGVLGRVRRCEGIEADCIRVVPLLGTCRICDGQGRTLYLYDKGMVNTAFLEALLERLGLRPATPADARRARRERFPTVRRTLDWDEADRTPAHRLLPWLRLAWPLALVMLAAQWLLLTRGTAVLGPGAALLLTAWLPVVFCVLYLLFPGVYVWLMPPRYARPGQVNQVLATEEWRAHHASLLGAWFTAGLALLPCLTLSRSQAVVDVGPMARLCAALALALGGACGARMRTQAYREWLSLAMFVLVLCFPLGYSLNYALCGPCQTVPATVAEAHIETMEGGGQQYILTFDLGDGRVEVQVPAETYERAQTDGTVPLHIRQSPLGIRLAHCPAP